MGIYLRHSNYTRVTGNTLLGNNECIVEDGCAGNIIENNNCGIGNPIPGYTWALVLLVVSGLSLLGLALKRKEERQTLSFS
jgi:parallel beta-helix repeat protein